LAWQIVLKDCILSSRYRIVTDLSARVSNLNPYWNSQNVNIEERFQKAMALVLGEFLESVQYIKNVWLPARNIVRCAIEKRFEVKNNFFSFFQL